MTDVTLLQNKVNRGKEAEQILEAPLFKEVAESLRKDCFRAFKGDDEDKALAARVEIRVFEAFLTKFVKIRQEGINAHKQIRNLQDRKEQGLSNDFNDLQGIA